VQQRQQTADVQLGPSCACHGRDAIAAVCAAARLRRRRSSNQGFEAAGLRASPDGSITSGCQHVQIGSRRSKMISLVVVLLFVVATLAFAAYALVRPLTHIHYRHPTSKLWRPLD
jgi:hypothetical protein